MPFGVVLLLLLLLSFGLSVWSLGSHLKPNTEEEEVVKKELRKKRVIFHSSSVTKE